MIKYEPAIVTFIDLLGFESLVNGRSAQEVHDLMKLVRQEATPDKTFDDSYEEDRLAEVFFFSDSIVRVLRIESDTNEKFPDGVLRYELFHLIVLQVRLIQEGVLLRGGMTVGDIFINKDENQVFGPAMIDAYKLESSLAIQPRIVLSPQVLVQLKSNPLLKKQDHRVAKEVDYFFQYVSTDSSGLQFIDYLKGSLDFDDSYQCFLDEHRAFVQSQLAKRCSPGVLSKLLWLKKYHNEHIDQVSPKLVTLKIV